MVVAVVEHPQKTKKWQSNGDGFDRNRNRKSDVSISRVSIVVVAVVVVVVVALGLAALRSVFAGRFVPVVFLSSAREERTALDQRYRFKYRFQAVGCQRPATATTKSPTRGLHLRASHKVFFF